MKILYVHRTRGQNVEGVHIRGIVDSLRAMGSSVELISVPGADPYRTAKAGTGKKSLAAKIWTGVSRLAPQIVFEAMELGYNVPLFLSCLATQRKERPDLIYERYALNTFASVLFARLFSIPIILEVNDSTGIQRNRSHKAERMARAIEDWTFKACDHIVTVSSEFKRIIVSRGVPESKVSFLPNAIDEKVFDPRLFGPGLRRALGLEGKTVVCFVGGFARWHGISLLLEIAAELVAACPKIHFLLVGDGKTFAEVNRAVAEKGLSSAFTLTGQVPTADVPSYLHTMDIGVIPDSNQYGSPVKLFEYMAMGAVPVAPDYAPVQDVVENGKTGLMFGHGNAQELKEALLRLCRDPEERNRISAAGRAQVMEHHLWKHNAARILEINGGLEFSGRAA